MKKLNLKIRKLLLKNTFYYVIAILSIMYALIVIQTPKHSIYTSNETSFIGTLENYSIEGDKLTFLLNGKEKLRCNYYFKTEKEKLEYENKLSLGIEIQVEGELTIPSNNTIPNTFNYKEYLYYHNVFYLCNTSKIDILSNETNAFYRIKNIIISRIKSFDKIDDYLLTFIIGDKSLLDDDVMSSYRSNGVTHLFAISGMHIGLFSASILAILKKIKVKESKRYLFTISFIWFYAFLTSFAPSVLRAGLLFTFLALNKIFYTEIKSINILLLVGSILVFINPFILKDIGFIYSFMTTLGLMYSSSVLNKHKILGTSIVAFFTSLPITINNFYELNLLSVLLNIIFVPYVSIIVYPLCLITFVFKFLEPVTRVFLYIMELMSNVFSRISIFHIITPKMTIVLLIIYYLVLFGLINKRFKTCISVLLTLILLNSLSSYMDGSYHVDFLDVGQGDSILIRYPYKKEVILIDTGGKLAQNVEKWKEKKKYNISDNTITYLHSLGIKKIDKMILTHGDADHMGEAINIVNNIEVSKVIFNCGSYNILEKRLIQLLNEKNIRYETCINELDNLLFLQTKDFGNENDNSNVIYTEIGGYKFLFTGDASITTESEILKKYQLSHIDVLKIGHHGSKTSSSTIFINRIQPTYSIISVGKNNKYGHPNKEILNNLKDSKMYRTDQDGSIMFKIKNNKINIETYSP